MAKITEVRLTLAAFIYGLEIDFKNLIKKAVAPFYNSRSFFQDEELEKKVADRFTKENVGVDYKNVINDVIDYLDFGDTFVILRKNNAFLDKRANELLNARFYDLV